MIHLGDVRVLTEGLIRAAETGVASGAAYIVGDRKPVRLRALVDLISQRLEGRPYPRWKTLPEVAFDLAFWVSDRVVRSDVWRTRFQLIAKSWYYDVEPAQRDLDLDLASTLECFGDVVDWYSGIHGT